MTQVVAAPTEQFYNVRDMIRDLKAQREKAMPLVQPVVPDLAALIAQEEATEAYLRSLGMTDMRCHPDSAANGSRHTDEQPAELYPVGARIFCRFLGMEATVVQTTQARVRVEWTELGIKGHPIRRGWLFREDCEPVETKTASR